MSRKSREKNSRHLVSATFSTIKVSTLNLEQLHAYRKTLIKCIVVVEDKKLDMGGGILDIPDIRADYLGRVIN